MNLKIAIIILHYGDYKFTQICLDSLVKVKSPNFKVYLLNNDYKNPIPKHHIVTKQFTPKKNLGFAQGNNYVIRRIESQNFDYYLFLNNDTKVDPDFLNNLINNLPEKNCIAGPIIKHSVKQKTFYDFGGKINWQKCQPKHINKTLVASSQKAIQRDFVSGCCLLISSKIIDQLGGFRKDYYLYLEDVELCLRAAKNNFKTYLIPSSQIFHYGSKSSTETKKILYSLRNSLKLTWQYCPNKYKLTASLFNLVFYPSLLIRWKLKKIFHIMFSSFSRGS
jgi:GT2 family glycosyltransferase